DLVGAVFPDQIACAENLPGEREVPDHPLVRQTIADCLDEAMDIAGLERLLARIESGDIHVIGRDLTEPSPLALEVLSARPYAFLDDAPLEERRTQAVMSRRWLSPEDAADIGRLDPDAIARVRDEAWPDAANADELHDARVGPGLRGGGGAGSGRWPGWPPGAGGPRRRNRDGPASGDVRGQGGAPAAIPDGLADRDPRSADRGIRRRRRSRLGTRGGAGRDFARTPRRPGRGHPGGADATLGTRAERHRGRARGARGRGLRDARTLHARRQRRRMVRTPAARPHQRLYGETPARRDRAGGGARFRPLPAGMAARDAGGAHAGTRRARCGCRP